MIADKKNREAPSGYLKRLYFDSIVYDLPTLQYLLRTVGEDRVLYGSDYPFGAGQPHPTRFTREIGLDPGDWEAMSGSAGINSNCGSAVAPATSASAPSWRSIAVAGPGSQESIERPCQGESWPWRSAIREIEAERAELMGSRRNWKIGPGGSVNSM